MKESKKRNRCKKRKNSNATGGRVSKARKISITKPAVRKPQKTKRKQRRRAQISSDDAEGSDASQM